MIVREAIVVAVEVGTDGVVATGTVIEVGNEIVVGTEAEIVARETIGISVEIESCQRYRKRRKLSRKLTPRFLMLIQPQIKNRMILKVFKASHFK